MGIRAYIVVQGMAARGIGPRGMTGMFDQAMREAMKEAAEFWRDNMQPRHFVPYAYTRYGYAKRTVKYEARKWRIFHHRNPLEFTGDSKRMILGAKRSPTVQKKGTGFQASIPIVAPKHFFQYNPANARVIYKAAELVRLSPKELDYLANFVNVRLTYHLNKYRYLKSVRRVA